MAFQDHSQLSQEQKFIELKEFIKSKHNPNLVDETKAPNDNRIYHIYEDGEITHQKGSYAYLNRTEFVEKYGSVRNIPADIFPITFKKNMWQTHGYAIVTQEDAYAILEKLKSFSE